MLCPYIANEPLTDAGWQAWDVLTRASSQLRIAPGAVIGIDLVAALRLGEILGHDLQALAELLPAGEAGLVKAMNNRLTDNYEDSRNP